jgi:quercetin dioxygenase-like cupin family protein
VKFIPATELLADTPDRRYRRTILETDPIRMVATSFAAGDDIRVHAHPGCEEVFFVVSGSATFVSNGDEVVAKEGDVVRIEPGEWHTLRPDPPAIVILAIVAPHKSPGAIFKDEQG